MSTSQYQHETSSIFTSFNTQIIITIPEAKLSSSSSWEKKSRRRTHRKMRYVISQVGDILKHIPAVTDLNLGLQLGPR